MPDSTVPGRTPPGSAAAIPQGVAEALSTRQISIALGRNTPPPTLSDSDGRQVEMKRLRAYRLGRLREQLRLLDVAGILLYDPINIRYATGSRNMAVWTLHNASRYCFVPTEGPIVIFEFHGGAHLAEGLETVAEVRPAQAWYFFGAGPRMVEKAGIWAAEIADLVALHGGGNRRIAADHCDVEGIRALAALGLEVVDGQGPCERARVIKSPDEVALMCHSISVCEAGMAKMREELKPGMTENELWSHLHQVNIARGGEWIETRLLASGGRTNPWFQECSDRIIRAGEMVSFDTDLVGPFGYCSDLSRSYFCGPGRPKPEQREIYRLAYEQIEYNMQIVRPGITFREIAEQSFRLPARYLPNRYSVIFHGVGFCDEYPHCAYAEDLEEHGYDGTLEAGMTICVESYIGAVDGGEGVKLEEQVLITETGVERLSTFPFEDELLGREF
jgi:Xaa-Pro aminopeptidase